MTEQLSINLAIDISYVYGTVNGEVADFSLTDPGVWSAIVPKSPKGKYEISITAYNSLGTPLVYNTIIFKFATVQPFKVDWTKDDYYNYDDLNRIENNTLATKDLIEILMGEFEIESSNVERDTTYIEFAGSLNRVERNINALKEKFYMPPIWIEPKTYWHYNDPFDYEDANRLENNLHLLM